MSELPRQIPYEDILQGKIFLAAIPYTFGRPLRFVEEDKQSPGKYIIKEDNDGFEARIDSKTGKKYSPIVQAVAEFKVRLAVVIQSDEWNQKSKYPFTVVVPIASLYPDDFKEPEVQRLVSKNDLPSMHYIENVTGRDAYITVNDPNRINKNMLFKPAIDIKLDTLTMEKVLKKLAICFEIKKIVQCDDCNRNCDKCEYKLAVNK